MEPNVETETQETEQTADCIVAVPDKPYQIWGYDSEQQKGRMFQAYATKEEAVADWKTQKKIIKDDPHTFFVIKDGKFKDKSWEIAQLADPWPLYVSKTDAQLEELARNYLQGQIFTSSDVIEQTDGDLTMLSSVFMIMGLAGWRFKEDMVNNEISLLYEYISKSSPRSVNGMPSFFSAQRLNKTDHMKFANRVKEIIDLFKARDAAINDPQIKANNDANARSDAKVHES